MQTPEWTKPALTGAGAGAIVLAIIGFGWGGWVTESSALKMSYEKSASAVTAALIPYCLQSSTGDPNSSEVLASFGKANNSYKRRVIVEEAGWATPLGAEKPDRLLAEACQAALAAKI